MDKWIAEAAKKVKARRAKRRQYEHAIENDLSTFWEAFVTRLEGAVREFNSIEELGGSIEFERERPEYVKVARATSRGIVSFECKGRSGVEVENYYVHPDSTSIGGNTTLLFDVDASGRLCLVENGEPVSPEAVVQKGLEPLFSNLE